MKNIADSYIKKYLLEHSRRRWLICTLFVLAIVVGTGVAWQLHYTGIAMTDEKDCGLEEHTHTEECYESILICGYEEEEEILIPDDNVSGGAFTAEIHTHTDDCYEKVLICDIPEHTHTADCVSNVTADVEDSAAWEETLPEKDGASTGGGGGGESGKETTEAETEADTETDSENKEENAEDIDSSEWEDTLPELVNVRAEDVVAVAESQLGYEESVKNFIIDEEGEKRGYTRYGAWYGSEYGKWDAMFVSFCLYYAGVPAEEFPYSAGAYAWIAELKPLDLYEEAKDHTPAVGDIIFTDSDGDEKADRTGIVTEIDEKLLTVIEGDSNDAVEEKDYVINSAKILGYASVPIKEEEETEETSEAVETEEAADNKQDSGSGSDLDSTIESNERVYTYSDENVNVSVTLPADTAVPLNAVLNVKSFSESTNKYIYAAEQAAELISGNIRQLEVYDISFLSDEGEDIPVSDEAGVTVSLTEGSFTDTVFDKLSVVHIHDEEEAQLLTDVTLNDSRSISFITEGFSTFAIVSSVTDGEELILDLITTEITSLVGASNGTDLQKYANEDGADVYINVYDSSGSAVSPNEDGEYVLKSGDGYSVRLDIDNLTSLPAGTYYYEFPKGVILDTTESQSIYITLNSADSYYLGTWSVAYDSSTDTYSIVFNIEDNSYSNFDISASASATFDKDTTEIELGSVTYKIEEGDDSGSQGATATVSKRENESITDPEDGKIYWIVSIHGGTDTGLANMVILDTIDDISTHWFTADDIQDMYISVRTSDDETHTHKLDVSSLVTLSSDGSSWNFSLPESFACSSCGETVAFPAAGEDSTGWSVYVYYTSTIVKESDGTIYVVYGNTVEFNGIEKDAEVTAGDSPSQATIIKEGTYVGSDGSKTYDDSNADSSLDDAYVQWTQTVNIPATTSGHYIYNYYLYDSLRLYPDGSSRIAYYNDLGVLNGSMEITAKYEDGTEAVIPNIDNATAGDLIAWELHSTSTSNGAEYGRSIYLYTRCNCDADTCYYMANGGDCECTGSSDSHSAGSGHWCLCWGLDQDVTLTVTYKTSVVYTDSNGTEHNVILDYLGVSTYFYNSVTLNYKPFTGYSSSGNPEWDDTYDSSSNARVYLPDLLKKAVSENASAANGEIVGYTITFNEAMADLSGYTAGVTFTDTMSKNLIFSPSSLVITAEDSGGNSRTLTADTEYTVDYTYSNEDGKNTATIVLTGTGLGAYKYTISYNAMVYITQEMYDDRGTYDYTSYTNNKVSVTVYGETLTEEESGRHISDVSVYGEAYSITLKKTDSSSGDVLEGAKFGVYGQDGTQITTVTTGSDGTCVIKTAPTDGIIFYEHTPYYLQEITPPAGYVLDTSKHWFWFCNNADDNCTSCQELINNLNLSSGDYKVDHNAKNTNIHITYEIGNEPGKEMPQAGGSGYRMFIITGLLMFGFSVFCMINKKIYIAGRRRSR